MRLINQDNQQVGVVPLQEALRLAREAELDLVEVAPDAKPPVCKIVDYRKVLYEQKKRARESRKRQKVIEVKEVKMRPSIDQHDYETKVKHIREFLEEGQKVKVTFFYRGRERAFQDRAKALLDKLAADLQDIGMLENEIRTQGTLNGAIFTKKR
ncbi:MAG: hypothetical protein KatS3mg130_0428 [Candidatus Sumerlaea sp.]|nr:MAG: hypothetical protein KatS3mg130_0428 [Candidatus Sumerlaea sp.]